MCVRSGLVLVSGGPVIVVREDHEELKAKFEMLKSFKVLITIVIMSSPDSYNVIKFASDTAGNELFSTLIISYTSSSVTLLL